MNDHRYKAFISYSHADESWAGWLHRALESYRVPKRLAGIAGSHGKVPARLTPIFRDRDELPSAADLGEEITGALESSESLLVICSPDAAQSKWVNEEIRYFRSLGKGDRIFCVIVAGDPQATDPKGSCFPPALLDSGAGKRVEPLAADARKWADGKPLAKLKLIAGLLGVGLDKLRQREQQRKRKLRAVFGMAGVVVLALVLFTVQSRLAERNAQIAREYQQASAENMLTQFLEQSERLKDVADLETRKAFGEVMSRYLADLDPTNLSQESRRQLGVALSNRAVILRAEGDLDQAMEVFRNARQILQQLVDDSPDDEEALFELSQAEYWIGQVSLDLGEVREAGASFQAYAEISHALHRLQPGNADWTMEAAYAQSNLGNLERRKAPSDPYLMLGFYKSALELNIEAASLNKDYESELADSHADLADAWLGVCDLIQARESRLRNVELAARFHQDNPASNRAREDHAHALSGLAWVQQLLGNTEMAMESLGLSLEIQEELVREDPQNLEKQFDLAVKSARMARLLWLAGLPGESWSRSVALEADIRDLLQKASNIQIEYAINIAAFLTSFADLAYHRGDPELADRLISEALDRLTGIAGDYPDNKEVSRELTLAYFYYWVHHDAELPDEVASTFLDKGREAMDIEGCRSLDIAFRQSLMTGADENARALSIRLVEKGYHEPDFMRFCLENGLCEGSGSG